MTEALESAIAKLDKKVEGITDVLTAIPGAIAEGISKALAAKPDAPPHDAPPADAPPVVADPPPADKLPEPVDEKPPRRDHPLNHKLW